MEQERRRKNKGKQPARGERRNVAYHQGPRRSSNAADAVRFLRENEIRNKLESRTHNREYPAERFISLRCLEEIWTFDCLERFLEILEIDSDTEFVLHVRRSLIKVLSILVTIRWDDWSRFEDAFLDRRRLREDSSLPFSLTALEDDTFLGKSFASDFLNVQFAYLPIVVEEGESKIYPRTRPLPFLKSVSTRIGAGAYGVVTKEVVACHQFKPKSEYKTDLIGDEITVARKWFRARGDFRKEAQNLAKLNSCLSNHQRIVKYLAVITVGDEDDIGSSKEFNILLPLADTDLKGFIYNEQFETTCHGVVDLVNEASNLVDAIQWLHGGLRIEEKIVVCCHMDIKLDNILVYLGQQASHVGWWKISDFGISSMVEREDRRTSARKKASALLTVPSPAGCLARITGSVRVSANRPGGPYSAPEMRIGNHVGPESDIWSFGCILFQVLLRGVGGIRLLTQMDNKRGSFENGSTNDYFCQETASGQQLHPQVVKWLESPLPRELSYKDTECAKKCKKIILGALKITPSDRPKAQELQKELLKIANGFEQYNSDVESVSSFVSSKSRPASSSLRPHVSAKAPPQIRVIPSPTLDPNLTIRNMVESTTIRDISDAPVFPENTIDHVPQSNIGPASASDPTIPPIIEHHLPSPQKPLTPPPEMYYRPVTQTLRHFSNPEAGPSSSQHTDTGIYSSNFHSPLAHRPHEFESSYRNPGQDSDSFKELSHSHQITMADRWPHMAPPGHPRPSSPLEHLQQQSVPNLYQNYGTEKRSHLQQPRMYPPAIHEWFENPSSPSTSTSSEPVRSPEQRRWHLEMQMMDPQPGLEAFEFPQPHTNFDGTYFLEDRSRQSSVQSSVPPVEARPMNDRGEPIPFQTPKDTFMTLVSSTRAKITFVAPNRAIVSTLYSPYSRQIIEPPTSCKWEKGCMAGDFLALFSSSTTTHPFHLYRLPTINRALEKEDLFFNEDLPSFEKFAVSRDCRVLLGGAKKLWLYQSCTDARQELMSVSKQTGKLQQVWFSTSGLLAFAWFSLPGNLHRIRYWDASNPINTGGIDHQIPPSDNSTQAIKKIIHFPKSPICILWKEYDVISIIQPFKPNSRKPQNNPHLKGLQAVVVTPDENAIVFIRSFKKGFRWFSKVSIGRIERNGDYRSLGNMFGEEILDHHLEKPDQCEVVIEATHSPATHVRVLIAHCNGKFEVKEVKLQPA